MQADAASAVTEEVHGDGFQGYKDWSRKPAALNP